MASWFEENQTYILVAVVVLLVLVMFHKEVSCYLGMGSNLLTGEDKLPCGCYKKCTCSNLPDDDDAGSTEKFGPPFKTEHLSDPVMKAGDLHVQGGGSDVLDALGYTAGGDAAWDEMIKVTDLDSSVHTNHEHFVADVRRFSSGANFTSVADDNTNAAFTNFVGLRRPQHVDILPDSRQQPDISQDVLRRNKPLIW